MGNGMEFEASIKTGITPDLDFIRENDEILNKFGGDVKNSPAGFLVFLLAGVGLFFVNKIAMAVCLLIAAAALFRFISKKKAISQAKNPEYMRMVYEEGLLAPGLIIKTEPLTVMAMASMVAQNNGEDQYACYVLQVDRLPGAGGTLYEKIPCSCMFLYEGGSYHSAMQPHPLYWGTQNQEEIRAALKRLEAEQEESGDNEWEIIKNISEEFPDLKPDQMLLLDSSYRPVGIKNYLDNEYTPVITQQVLDRYPKDNPEVSHITDDIPAASLYNKMIDLALECQVYEYVGTHCKDEDFAPLSNPGYFTYIGDSMTFIEALDRRSLELAQGEYPLLAGAALLTTKGCWRKKEFTPWRDIVLDAVISSDEEIQTRVNGKLIVQFKVNTQYYRDHESFTGEDMTIVRQIELKRINQFLRGLRELQA